MPVEFRIQKLKHANYGQEMKKKLALPPLLPTATFPNTKDENNFKHATKNIAKDLSDLSMKRIFCILHRIFFLTLFMLEACRWLTLLALPLPQQSRIEGKCTFIHLRSYVFVLLLLCCIQYFAFQAIFQSSSPT